MASTIAINLDLQMNNILECENSAGVGTNSTTRIFLSLGLLTYLGIVILGPLSNPISSANLTAPLAQKVAPVHQALFLGHGYRFFGPDPGPSHILEYEITHTDGSQSRGRFPDRDMHWPRLRYHRWFMLSETIFEESIGLIDEQQHQEILADMNAEIEDLRMKNELATMNDLVQRRDRSEQEYQFLKKRIDLLLSQIAGYLLDRHDGRTVELFLRERLIARPVDVRSRIRLNDPRFLSEPNSIGKFDADEMESVEVLE